MPVREGNSDDTRMFIAKRACGCFDSGTTLELRRRLDVGRVANHLGLLVRTSGHRDEDGGEYH
jgi:hypothetical protein